MNVEELIEKLSKMPKDAVVFFDFDNGCNHDYFGCEITGARYENEIALVTNWARDESCEA